MGSSRSNFFNQMGRSMAGSMAPFMHADQAYQQAPQVDPNALASQLGSNSPVGPGVTTTPGSGPGMAQQATGSDMGPPPVDTTGNAGDGVVNWKSRYGSPSKLTAPGGGAY